MEIFGYIGTALLLFSYIILISKWNKWFVLIDTVASAILTLHAYLINDVSFIIVNAFVTIMLIVKLWQKGRV